MCPFVTDYPDSAGALQVHHAGSWVRTASLCCRMDGLPPTICTRHISCIAHLPTETLALLLILEARLLERVCIRIFSKGRNGFKVRDQVGFQ